MTELRLTIPLVPPSGNHYVKHTRTGRHYVTSEALAFKDAVAIFARGAKVSGKEYQVSISIFLGAGQKGDLDNFGKCTLDSLTAAGVIQSDAWVTLLTMKKSRDAKNPRTEIIVRQA